MRPVDAGFFGNAVAALMDAIQSGDLARAAGAADGGEYDALADLVMHDLRRNGRAQ